MPRADDLRDELALLDAEEELVRLKEADDPEALREHKLHLRELRRQVRTRRAGSVTAAPDAVTVTATSTSGGDE